MQKKQLLKLIGIVSIFFSISCKKNITPTPTVSGPAADSTLKDFKLLRMSWLNNDSIGSPATEVGRAKVDPYDVEYRHSVIMSRSYYIAMYELTRAKYALFLQSPDTNYLPPNQRKITYYDTKITWQQTPQHPIVNTSWYAAIVYCNWLTKQNKALVKDTCYTLSFNTDGTIKEVTEADYNKKGYRLPTEAEWEIACRGGNSAAYSFGNDTSILRDYAWYNGNSGGTTHTVGDKKPNSFGLYDMHGNVWEWCWDEFDDRYYNTAEARGPNPMGSTSGTGLVVRGGDYFYQTFALRSAERAVGDIIPLEDIGIRLARTM